MRLRATHTLATMEVSRATFDEIAGKLREAGYDHAILDERWEASTLDMTGIGLVAEEPAPPPPVPQDSDR